jgi:uncharacterized protein YaiE (UPF0345 family)
MADKRISQLIERTDIANNDVLPIVASGATTTNKVTISTIQDWMQDNLDVGVTSVGITFGTSGTDINASGSPVTSSGNITINLPTASATNRGALSSADWITFNSKQPAGNYVTLDTAQTITAQKTFTTSGSSDTMIISHGSGSGFALDVIKAGSGEAIRVTKTSGSGNAMSITGGNFSAEAATFSGIVTTTPDAVINSINIGKGAGNVVSNTRVGLSALQANTTGNQNTAVGNQVLNANTSAAFNTGIGYNALLKTTTGSANTAVGAQSLVENTTGPQNTAVGVFALQVNTTAAANTAIGYSSLYSNTTGLYNTGLGSETLHQNTTGSNNTAAGRVALRDNTTGSQNAAFGNLALYFNTTGSQNTGIGYSALGGITTGINNVAVGHVAGNLINSGTANITSSNSVYLGHDTRASASGNTNEIVIGHEGRGNGSNTVTIGNSSITNNYFTGNIRGGAFIRTGGTSSQFLKADGSVDSSTYLTTGSAASTYVTLDTTQTISGAKTFTSILTIGTSGNSVIYEESGSLILQTGASADLVIPSTGASTFNFGLNVTGALGVTGALNGTSAAFSSTASFLTNTGASTSEKQIIIANTGGSMRAGVESSAGGAIQLGTLAYAAVFGNQSNAATQFTTNGTARLTILGDGNIGIGTASPVNYTNYRSLHVSGATSTSSAILYLTNSTETIRGLFFAEGSDQRVTIGSQSDHPFTFVTNDTERMRITAGGYLKASNNGSYNNATGPYHEFWSTDAGNSNTIFKLDNASYSGDGVMVYATRNTTNNTFFALGYYNVTAAAYKFRVADSGNVTNTNNSYGALSDIKLKENITDATPKLYDLLKVKVKNYNFIGTQEKQLGVIAQELEEVFPAMIDESEDFEEVEVPQLDEEGNEVLNEKGEVVTTKKRVSKGTTTKSVKYSVFVPMLIKAIQELKAEIDSLKNQIK